MIWSKEQIERILSLRMDGMSSGKVAKLMSDELRTPITRNSIIGVCHRYDKRPKDVKVDRKFHLAPKLSFKKFTLPTIPRPRLPIIPSEPRYERSWSCQYIDDSGVMCNAPSNGSWCETHKARVYIKR
jgi:hypothetical protein